MQPNNPKSNPFRRDRTQLNPISDTNNSTGTVGTQCADKLTESKFFPQDNDGLVAVQSDLVADRPCPAVLPRNSSNPIVPQRKSSMFSCSHSSMYLEGNAISPNIDSNSNNKKFTLPSNSSSEDINSLMLSEDNSNAIPGSKVNSSSHDETVVETPNSNFKIYAPKAPPRTVSEYIRIENNRIDRRRNALNNYDKVQDPKKVGRQVTYETTMAMLSTADFLSKRIEKSIFNKTNEPLLSQQESLILKDHYPHLMILITIISYIKFVDNVELSGVNIINFLCGQKSLKYWASEEKLPLEIAVLIDKGIIEKHNSNSGRNKYRINERIGKLLHEVFKDKLGVLLTEEQAVDYISRLYLHVLPEHLSKLKKGFTKGEEWMKGVTVSVITNFLRINLCESVARKVAESVKVSNIDNSQEAIKAAKSIEASKLYNHQEFNKLFAHKSFRDDLTQIQVADVNNYLTLFASYIGISISQIPLYLEMYPITLSYKQELVNLATSDYNHKKEAACAREKSEFVPVKSSNLESLEQLRSCLNPRVRGDGIVTLVKYGVIISMPGVLIFGVKGCGRQYNQRNVHLGENIHAIGLDKPHQTIDIKRTNQAIYIYYKLLYKNIIEKACTEGKIDHLILNGVGDGAFANNDEERKINAIARIDALFECKKFIMQKDMKITLPDFANNFGKLDADEFKVKLKLLDGLDYKILSGKEDGDIQGQALANRVTGSQYIGLVNASDANQYGCWFMTKEGDHTVEERIWNQLFFGLHFDAIMKRCEDNTALLQKFIKQVELKK